LMKHSNKKIYALGLKNKSAGFSKRSDNLPPDATRIFKFFLNILRGQ